MRRLLVDTGGFVRLSARKDRITDRDQRGRAPLPVVSLLPGDPLSLGHEHRCRRSVHNGWAVVNPASALASVHDQSLKRQAMQRTVGNEKHARRCVNSVTNLQGNQRIEQLRPAIGFRIPDSPIWLGPLSRNLGQGSPDRRSQCSRRYIELVRPFECGCQHFPVRQENQQNGIFATHIISQHQFVGPHQRREMSGLHWLQPARAEVGARQVKQLTRCQALIVAGLGLFLLQIG